MIMKSCNIVTFKKSLKSNTKPKVKFVAESRFAELKEREKEARKQIVIESALALFAQKPFYEVGMREVADEAGISPATIYRYFPRGLSLFRQTIR